MGVLQEKNLKLLVARTDRLGDVLLALPALAYIRSVFLNCHIDFLYQKEYEAVLSPYLKSKNIHSLHLDTSWSGVLRAALAKEKYSGALFLFTNSPLLLAAWRSHIKVRVGIYSKPYSFFTLTSGLKQHRSWSEKNEAEYNLDLAMTFVTKLSNRIVPPPVEKIELPVNQVAEAVGSKALLQLGLSPTEDFNVLHPGMGGSALNLSYNEYLNFINHYNTRFKAPLIVSVGPAATDNELVEKILVRHPNTKILKDLKIPELMEVFRKANLVIAPSTGPLHLAHYVGTKTLGLYSPIRNQRALRWSPWGGTGESHTLTPDIACPSDHECLGEKCEHYYCMDNISWGAKLSETLLRKPDGLQLS